MNTNEAKTSDTTLGAGDQAQGEQQAGGQADQAGASSTTQDTTGAGDAAGGTAGSNASTNAGAASSTTTSIETVSTDAGAASSTATSVETAAAGAGSSGADPGEKAPPEAAAAFALAGSMEGAGDTAAAADQPEEEAPHPDHAMVQFARFNPNASDRALHDAWSHAARKHDVEHSWLKDFEELPEEALQGFLTFIAHVREWIAGDRQELPRSPAPTGSAKPVTS